MKVMRELFLLLLVLSSCSIFLSRRMENDRQQWKEYPHNWKERIKKAQSDTLQLQQIYAEIRKEAEIFSRQRKSAPALYTAYLGYRLLHEEQDSVKAEKIVERIRKKFPGSEQTWELAQADFYDNIYPVWNNDSLKIDIIGKLLKKYRKTGWRRTMYQYLFSSLYNTEEYAELLKKLREFRREFPDDYLSYYSTAYYCREINYDIDQALDFAEKSFNRSRIYPYVEYYPPEQWALERRAARVKTGAVYGSLLNLTGEYEMAEDVLQSILADNDLTVEDETTLAACHYYLGLNSVGRQDTLNAICSCINTLLAGDSRNQYTPLADSLLRFLLPDLQDHEKLEFIRSNIAYNDVCFQDVTHAYGLSGIRAGKIAWGDYDNNGYQDLMLDGCRIFRNNAGSYFTEVTDSIFVGQVSASGGIWGDLDNDGDLDLVTKDPELAWINDAGRFYPVSEETDFLDNGIPTEGLGLGDFNRDGLLDIYLANYEFEGQYLSDQFFCGLGQAKFSEQTATSNILPADGENRAGRGVSPGDFDNDQDLDIFVANYRLTDNFLLVNNGAGVFENAALPRGVSGTDKEGWWGHTIGAEWADWDNDGDLDLITANLAHPRYIDFSDRTMLYRNSGAPDYSFTDIRAKTGIRFEETHSEPAWGDLDNDGNLDLYINDVYEGRRSFLYMNDGDETFREVTYPAGVRHFNGWGVAFADIDNDGDLDILAGGGEIQLFRNDTQTGHNWLEIMMSGKDHGDAIGSRFYLYNQNILLTREIQGGKGSTNQHSLVQHFGLGSNEPPFTLRILYPDGSEDTAVIWECNKLIIIQ